MQLNDQELLKSLLYDGRHDEDAAEVEAGLVEALEEVPPKKSAAQLREKQIAREKAKKRRAKIVTRIAAPLMLLAILVLAVIAVDHFRSWGTVHPNVEIAHIDVGGKTPDEAREYLDERLRDYGRTPVSVVYVPEVEVDTEGLGDSENSEGSEEGQEAQYWEIFASDVGLSFDTTRAVEQAYAFGRSGDVFESLRDRFLSYFETYQVELVLEESEDFSHEDFELIRNEINVAPVDSRVVLDEGVFVVESGSDGIRLSEGELMQLMANALLSQRPVIEVPLEVHLRDIDDENALRAATAANDMAYSPLELNYGDKSWTLEHENIVPMLRFVRSDKVEEDNALVPFVDSAALEGVVLKIYICTEEVRERLVVGQFGSDVGSSPVNARFIVEGDQVSIRPSQTGSGVDSEQLARDVAEALVGMEPQERSIEIAMSDIQPRRSTEDAEAMGIQEQVASYTTEFSAGDAPRSHNIRLIASMLDGILIPPGEEFSFNEATGDRSAADGFQAAGVIIAGELSTSVGGGICQVSTTMFNTAMYAGTYITQRVNHSLFFPNYLPGRDAAVSIGVPDFRFINTLDSYILVATSSTNSSVTIAFFGTDPGYEVEIRTGTFNREDYGTEEIRDNTLPLGERIVERPGRRGGRVNVYYTVRDGDAIIRRQTFSSTYRTIDERVRVGTMRVEVEEYDD